MLTESQRASMAIASALRAGDLDSVRAAFADNSDLPNVRDPLTWTHLLALAIPNARGIHDYTPLHLAVRANTVRTMGEGRSGALLQAVMAGTRQRSESRIR